MNPIGGIYCGNLFTTRWFMSLRSPKEFENAAIPPSHGYFLDFVMPAEAGIQEREGMDTGFRR
jgi:hypothetical protein